MFTEILSLASILLPVITGLIIFFLAKVISLRKILLKTSIIALTATLAILVWLAIIIQAAPVSIEYFTIPLGSSLIKLGLYIDYIAIIPALISTFICLSLQIYTLNYYSQENNAYNITGYNRSHPLTLIFTGALIGAVFSADLIGLLFSIELVTICTYLFINYPGQTERSLKAAVKSLILTHIGGLALLTFTLIMLTATGTTQITALKDILPPGTPLIIVGATLILCAAMPKTDQIPFHTWFPDSTTAPSPSIIVFHVCGFQVGVYLLLRFLFHIFSHQLAALPLMPLPLIFGDITIWNFTVMMIGSITLIIGAVYGMLENNYKRIIAFTTVSETGLILIAAGLSTPLGITACLYYTISHTLISTLLFLSYGSVEYATGKTNINEIGNLYQYMPLTAVGAIISVIAVGGMPLLSEFIGKYLIINAALSVGSPFFIIIMFIGAALHIVIAIRILNSVFLTTTYTTSDKKTFKDPSKIMLAPIFTVAILVFIFGVAPTILLDVFIKPAIIQSGLTLPILESFDLIITGTGFLSFITIGASALTISGMLAYVVLVGRRRKTRKKSVEAEKPFIGGEDITVIKTTYTEQFYYYLVDLLKLKKTARILDVDKALEKITSLIDRLSRKMLKLDVGPYLKAVLMFLTGTLIITLIALII
ncbi:MAG: proton-conducting transporter membrane subunit [Candidatus Odinarchaeota archaeon]